MKFLIYELFSGVGFCNQLFSFETAIYLSNITNRKLILLVKFPLCHWGRASWDYGNFVDFFSNEYKKFLPLGIDVYYKSIPTEIRSIISNKDECHHLQFTDFFSKIVIIDNNISLNDDINKFCGGRNINRIDFDLLNNYNYVYYYIDKYLNEL